MRGLQGLVKAAFFPILAESSDSAILFSFHLSGHDRKNLPRKWSCRPFGCQKLDTIGSFGAIGLR